MSSTSNHTNTNARSTQEHVPDILGPSLVRKRGVEHIVVRQKRRFPEVDPRLVKNLIDTNDMRRRERSLPPPPKSPQPPQPQPQRPGTGLQGLRVRPPPPNRLREIPDEYDYPVTALLVDMEERFGRPLTIDIPDIPTPSSRRVVRDHDANKAANANVNVDKDKPLPPTPGSPAPSLASSGSAYSNYAEDDSEESNDNEPKIDMSEYVVVDLVSCEVRIATEYDLRFRHSSLILSIAAIERGELQALVLPQCSQAKA